LVLFGAPVALAATGETPVGLTKARDARFEVVKAYHDGPWLKPTLDLLRSETEWDARMASWLAEERVVGAEAAPKIDWKHQVIVVLSLGSQFGQVGVTVNKCQVEGDLTILDLHFDVQDQWDPYGEPSHPAVLVAVDRADVKNVELRCDATVDGLPPGLSRRTFRENPAGTGSAVGVSETAVAPAAENVSLAETRTTWGRVKAGYRGAVMQ
jgi:hypothetical protein